MDILSGMATSIAINSLRIAKCMRNQDSNGLMIHLYAWSKLWLPMQATMQKMKHVTRSYTMPLTHTFIAMLEMGSANWPSTSTIHSEAQSLSKPLWGRTKSKTSQASLLLSKYSTQSYSVDIAQLKSKVLNASTTWCKLYIRMASLKSFS